MYQSPRGTTKRPKNRFSTIKLSRELKRDCDLRVKLGKPLNPMSEQAVSSPEPLCRRINQFFGDQIANETSRR